jgi:hypothetical protein
MSAPHIVRFDMNDNISLKDSVKLFLIRAAPKWLMRPLAESLWRTKLIKRHYYVFSRIGSPDSVLQGPFRGMKYIPCSVASAIVPKYLGTYEKELWPAIEEICRSSCDVFVDIGSAEGYYAVGVTLRVKPKQTHCFDINPRAHLLLKDVAQLNGVSETIHTHNSCSSSALESVLINALHPVIIMDCEGAEYDLLDPLVTPSLTKARIIVEIHEIEKPGVTEAILRRFSQSHNIERVKTQERSIHDLPYPMAIGHDNLKFAMSEGRAAAMEWFILRPHAAVAAAKT